MDQRRGSGIDGLHKPPVGIQPASVPAEVAQAVWQASAAARKLSCHDGHRCPTEAAPYTASDPYGLKVASACEATGCLDLYQELLTRLLPELERKPQAGPIHNLGAYIARSVAHSISDLGREHRVSRGFPAKPGRSDGAPGRVIKRLAAEPGIRGEWLPILFRLMRCYPYSGKHSSTHWSVGGFADERKKCSDHRWVSDQEILGDIDHVTQVATHVLGAVWVLENFTIPLQANGAPEELQEPDGRPQPSVEDQSRLSQLVREYHQAIFRGESRRDAIAYAIKRVYGYDIQVTAEVDEAFRDIWEEQRS